MKGKKRRPLVTFLMGVLFSGSLLSASAASGVDVEIGHLLDALEKSGCAFYRNGRWYSASEARAHVEKKYRYLLDTRSMNTTEDFIDRAATASRLSGKPYQVKCDGHEPVSSAEWLTRELYRLRRASTAPIP